MFGLVFLVKLDVAVAVAVATSAIIVDSPRMIEESLCRGSRGWFAHASCVTVIYRPGQVVDGVEWMLVSVCLQ